MKVHLYEKAFLWLGAVLLVCCLGALLYASLAHGIHLPGKDVEVDPAAITTTPPFDNPGVRHLGGDEYEAVMIGRMWSFEPAEIRVPAGANVTFVATTPDVLHGLNVEGTRLNMMLIPGQVSRNSYRFTEPGEYLIIC
ncbi:MAG: cytochrome C oxidase subunit II, partial [Rhodothermales bacterium]